MYKPASQIEVKYTNNKTDFKQDCCWDPTMQLWQHATYHELAYRAQNLFFCLGLKYILKVVFNAASLAYLEVNVS